MNEGWLCPRCGKVNAPDVKECGCGKDVKPLDIEKMKKWFDNPKDIPKYPIYYPDMAYRPPRWCDWYTTC